MIVIPSAAVTLHGLLDAANGAIQRLRYPLGRQDSHFMAVHRESPALPAKRWNNRLLSSSIVYGSAIDILNLPNVRWPVVHGPCVRTRGMA